MFKSLVSAVSEQHQEIKQVFLLFPYFETWSPDLIAECCRVSSIAEFPPDKIILGPDAGNSHTVYFVLEGVCRMMRNLDVEVKVDSRQRMRYKLHKVVGLENSNYESKREEYSSRLFNQIIHESQSRDMVQFFEEKEEKSGEVRDKLEVNVEKDENKSEEENFDEIMGKHPEIIENREDLDLHEDTITASDTNTPPEADNNAESTNTTANDKTEISEDPLQEQKTEPIGKEISYKPDHHLKILEECKRRRKETNRVSKKTSLPEKPPNAKRFSIQIGFLYRGACFGLEKSERENFLLSATTVRCLKIPKGFLLRHNPCNIWKRIGLFHSLYLPKDEKVFQFFRSDRMWVEGKKKLTEEIVSVKNISNHTLICDVPYSIRLSEVR